MFRKLGRVVVKHPIWTICVWIVVGVLVVALAPTLKTSNDESDFLPAKYESIKAMDIGNDKFSSDKSADGIGVFSRTDGKELAQSDFAAICKAQGSLAANDTSKGKNKNIAKIVLPTCDEQAAGTAGGADASKAAGAGSGGADSGGQSSAQVKTSIMMNSIFVTSDTDMAGLNKDLADQVENIRDDANAALKGTGLRYGVTGGLGQSADAVTSTGSAETIVTMATVVLIIVLLGIIFRSPIAALLPIFMIALLIVVSNYAMAWLNDLFNLNAMSMISVILAVVMFGIGTDYYLFLMFRYRERLRLGDDPKTAMVKAVGRVGEAIASAASVVIVAFAVLAFSSMGMMKSMGPDLAISVFVMFCASLTLTPAIVSLIGPKVFWPSKAWMTAPEGTRFGKIGHSVGKHSPRYAAISTLLMVVIALCALGFKSNFDFSSSTLPKSADSVKTLNILKETMPSGAVSPTEVFLTSSQGKISNETMASYGQKLMGIKGATLIDPATQTPITTPTAETVYGIPSQDQTAVQYTLWTEQSNINKAMDFISGSVRPAAHDAAPAGTSAYVGGQYSIFIDVNKSMDRDYSVVFPIAAIAIFLILAFQLRSLVAPIYLVVAVALGFVATLGMSVLVFQNMAGESGLLFIMPLVMYMFVVAIGTDYNILMISRLREEARNGRPPHEAAAEAIRHAGPTVAAAAFILAGSFASLMLAGNAMMTQMGFSIAIGILIVSFIMAMFFTPSFTGMIGHNAWWPGHQDVRKGQVSAPSEQPAEPIPSGSK